MRPGLQAGVSEHANWRTSNLNGGRFSKMVEPVGMMNDRLEAGIYPAIGTEWLLKLKMQ